MTDFSHFALVVETDPRKIVGGRYAIDPVHTRVLFNVVHFGVSTYWGEFYDPAGWLEIDPERPEKTSLSVGVPSMKVKTNSEVLDAELRSPDWFDAQRFPRITIVGEGLRALADGSAKFTGDFTLHGITKPIDLDIAFIGGSKNPFTGKPTIGFEASATISRRAFGVSAKYPIVGDAVKIIVSAAFDYA
jgi:polyisoprenoid-binding protein YceI